MATTAGTQAKGPAPWKADFLTHVNQKMDSPEFVLSTLHTAPAGSPVPYIPHARYCIFRGMWAELPENKHNDAPKNEQVFESDMPVFTTDVRMEKVPEIFGTSHGHADNTQQAQGSGGGGPVEAVWWVKDTMTQWRMQGQAFVVAPDIEGSGEESSGVRTVKSELGKRMYVVKPGSEQDWSWQTELTGHFGNCSPGMRGTFKNPPPGKRQSEPYNDKEESVGNKVDDLHDPVARKHFRAVVIRPYQVEQCDITPGKGKRFRYTFNNQSQEWTTEETWP